MLHRWLLGGLLGLADNLSDGRLLIRGQIRIVWLHLIKKILVLLCLHLLLIHLLKVLHVLLLLLWWQSSLLFKILLLLGLQVFLD